MPAQNPNFAESEAQRVIVFMDEANVYHDARRCFHADDEAASSHMGRVWPPRYARELVGRQPHGVTGDRVLEEVRVYTGMPSGKRDPKGYAAHRRQMAGWEAANVMVKARPLRYPPSWPKVSAMQKGVDVEIALDIVTMAIEGAYDVAILASTDTDLGPALEAVNRVAEGPRIEVAAFRGGRQSKRLNVPGQHVWCHFVEDDEYEKCRDYRNYNLA